MVVKLLKRYPVAIDVRAVALCEDQKHTVYHTSLVEPLHQAALSKKPQIIEALSKCATIKNLLNCVSHTDLYCMPR